MTPEERDLARSVTARPAADGHYYDPVMAAIADRDELLARHAALVAAAREVVAAWDRGEPWWPVIDALRAALDGEPSCPVCGGERDQYGCLSSRDHIDGEPSAE